MTSSRRSPFRPFALFALAATIALLTPPARAQAAVAAKPSLARAQELVDAGRAAEAIALLDQALGRNPDDAKALLLRSTARFQTGDLPGGKKDLERALVLDPSVRQAWLNRGAVDLAEKRYDRALEAFQQGERLDPKATDNDVNIGAVLLLKGDLGGASERFRRYLQASTSSADAHYLVASNYALAGYAALAIETLRRAIDLDERQRLRARRDPVFSSLDENKAFETLLGTDSYRLPPGALALSRSYKLSYSEDGRLVQAVVQGMKSAGEKLDPTFESGPGWTILWGDLRIKVSGQPGQPGLVEISAPVDRLSAADWKRRTDKLLAAIEAEVQRLTPRKK